MVSYNRWLLYYTITYVYDWKRLNTGVYCVAKPHLAGTPKTEQHRKNLCCSVQKCIQFSIGVAKQESAFPECPFDHFLPARLFAVHQYAYPVYFARQPGST